MRLSIVYNHDFAQQAPGPARCSQDSILGVVAAFETALRARGTVAATFAVRDAASLDPRLLAGSPDLVINLCESLGGDARGEMVIPALFDLAGVPYTGSGPLAIALCLHKHKAKEILRARGVPTPDWVLVERQADLARAVRLLPAIVKPAREDASIGIDRRSLAREGAHLQWACERVLDELRQPALVERFVDGRELNVALLGPAAPFCAPRVLPIHEIDFAALEPSHPRIVTYAAKWDESAPEFHATPPIPCALPSEGMARVEAVAREAFAALELRDYGRVDIRLAADGTPFVIEVNPNCDLSPDAGFARAARGAGLDFESLVWRIVEIAGSRHVCPSAAADRTSAARADARGDHKALATRGDLRPGAGPTRPG